MGFDGAEIKRRKLQKAMETHKSPDDAREGQKQEAIEEPIVFTTVDELEAPAQVDETPNRNLIDCTACGREVSKNAAACPHCGEPFKEPEKIIIKEKKERQNIGCGGGFLIIIFLLWFASLFSPDKSSTTKTTPDLPPKPKTAQELRQEKIGECFSGWDGSHRELTNRIKKSMNDPDSYEHDETQYIDKGNYLIVITSFRGKNAFGGVIRNSITAKTDMNCNVIEIIE